MNKESFFKNPACPVGCEYCMVTKINQRSSRWVKQHRYGLNKTLLFVNKFPFEKEVISLEDKFLKAEFVGFEGISDPFWEPFEKDLRNILFKTLNSKKLVLVTKFALSEEKVKFLSQFPQLVIAVSLTGLDKYNIEKTSTKQRIKNIELCLKHDIPALPFIHPYIHTLTDLSFLKELKNLGIKDISVKGFRFNKENMPKLNALLKGLYNSEEEVLLGNEYLKEKLKEFNRIEFREWVHFYNLSHARTKNLHYKESLEIAEELLSTVTISSSEKNIQEIKKILIERKL